MESPAPPRVGYDFHSDRFEPGLVNRDDNSIAPRKVIKDKASDAICKNCIEDNPVEFQADRNRVIESSRAVGHHASPDLSH